MEIIYINIYKDIRPEAEYEYGSEIDRLDTSEYYPTIEEAEYVARNSNQKQWKFIKTIKVEL